MEFLQELFYVLKKFLFQTGAIRRDIFNAYINKASEFLFQTGAIRRLSEEDGQEVLKMGKMSEVAYPRYDLQDGQEDGQEVLKMGKMSEVAYPRSDLQDGQEDLRIRTGRPRPYEWIACSCW